MLLVVPLSVAALLDALKEVEADRAPLVPSCHYSVPLLLVVLLTQVLAAAFIVYWFSKCCKCARTKKASRLATSMTAIIATVYTVVIISFAVSVFLFVNKTTNSSNEESTTTQTTVATTATTDSNNDNESEVCIKTSSAPFLFATFYLFALLIFFAMAVLMTCCDYHYKRKEKNFLLYLRDTVRIYENEGREDAEETAL
jgi:cytochrome bd-type quinol oxidase subunit 2